MLFFYIHVLCVCAQHMRLIFESLLTRFHCAWQYMQASLYVFDQCNHALDDLKSGALEPILSGRALMPIRRCLISTSSNTTVPLCEYACVRVRDTMCACLKMGFWKCDMCCGVQEKVLFLVVRQCTIHLCGRTGSLWHTYVSSSMTPENISNQSVY